MISFEQLFSKTWRFRARIKARLCIPCEPTSHLYKLSHQDVYLMKELIMFSFLSGKQLIWWPKGNPPQDRTIIKADVKTVSMSLYIPMVIVSIIGIILAIILIIINNKFDYRRIIQHSHPSCNNLILMGNILCLLATIPLGFNTKLV